jgi:hypothetical protein
MAQTVYFSRPICQQSLNYTIHFCWIEIPWTQLTELRNKRIPSRFVLVPYYAYHLFQDK